MFGSGSLLTVYPIRKGEDVDEICTEVVSPERGQEVQEEEQMMMGMAVEGYRQ